MGLWRIDNKVKSDLLSHKFRNMIIDIIVHYEPCQNVHGVAAFLKKPSITVQLYHIPWPILACVFFAA